MKEDVVPAEFFRMYARFAQVETQLALIEERDFRIIYAFYQTLIELIKPSSNSDSRSEALDVLSCGVDFYVQEARNRYPWHREEPGPDAIDANMKLDKSCVVCFEAFVFAYQMVARMAGEVIIDGMLIEFNNFLSHQLSRCVDVSRPDGCSHLYRGMLDGYKEILFRKSRFLLEDSELLAAYARLRLDELKRVGQRFACDGTIAVEYRDVTTALLSG